MSARPNGSGRNGGNGRGEGAPRWVEEMRRLHEDRMDAHERRMSEMERKRREDKAAHERRMAAHEERMDEMKREHEERMDEMKREHEERMDKMDRDLKIYRNEELETRRQTREVVADIARLDAQRAKDGKALAEALRVVHGRVARLETARKG